MNKITYGVEKFVYLNIQSSITNAPFPTANFISSRARMQQPSNNLTSP